MKKLISILLIATIIFSFTACGVNKKDLFIAPDGTEYLVVRDDNGNIIVNGSNKLQVYILNENNKKQKSDSGEYITEYIDFNGQVVVGNTVETEELRFEIPKNFTVDNDNPGHFYSEDIDGEIFISYRSNMDDHIKGVQNNCEDRLESFGSEVYSYTKYTINVGETECTAFKSVCTSSEFYKHEYTFFIPDDSYCYYVNCLVGTDNANKVDFNKFIESFDIK